MTWMLVGDAIGARPSHLIEIEAGVIVAVRASCGGRRVATIADPDRRIRDGRAMGMAISVPRGIRSSRRPTALAFTLYRTPLGGYVLADVSRDVAYMVTSVRPEMEARIRGYGDQLGARQLEQVRRGDYGDAACAWLLACEFLEVQPRFSWQGIENVVGDCGSVSPSVKPRSTRSFSTTPATWTPVEIAVEGRDLEIID